MSHNLATVNGKVAMAYAGDTPWHGLGNHVSNNLSPDEMLKAANLDWKVVKEPTFYQRDGILHPTGHSALVRNVDGKLLDLVTDNWNPVQNSEAFEFFREFVESGEMELHTAGALDDGRIVWALAKTTDYFTINAKDQVESHLLFTNPHIYGRGIDIRFTAVRVVCWNTLTLALRGGNTDLSVKLDHRHKFDPEFAKDVLGLSRKRLDEYGENANFLASHNFKEADIERYLSILFPNEGKTRNVEGLSRPAQTVLNAIDTQPGSELSPGTWWQAFNAVTYATDHLLGHNDESRMRSSWYGFNRVRKTKALKLAMEMAEAAS